MGVRQAENRQKRHWYNSQTMGLGNGSLSSVSRPPLSFPLTAESEAENRKQTSASWKNDGSSFALFGHSINTVAWFHMRWFTWLPEEDERAARIWRRTDDISSYNPINSNNNSKTNVALLSNRNEKAPSTILTWLFYHSPYFSVFVLSYTVIFIVACCTLTFCTFAIFPPSPPLLFSCARTRAPPGDVAKSASDRSHWLHHVKWDGERVLLLSYMWNYHRH